MMNAIPKLAGLLLACLLAVPLFAMTPHSTVIHDWGAPLVIGLMVAGGLFLFGTVTVNYQWPVQGTTAPTVSQMKPLSLVTAAIFFSSDSDTLALITHNMQLGTVALPTNPGSLVNETSCLFPLVGWYYQTGGSNTTILNGSIVSSSVFQITKASAASSLGTVNFFLLRPWTGLR
jgi:hypothetical protein